MIAAAAKGDGFYLRVVSSASAMWTANAATVAPSADTADGKAHFTPANLRQMFHRAIEAETTTRVLRAIFPEGTGRFVVHDPLPGGEQLADEGAANHTRLATSRGSVHVFGWGRRAWESADAAPSAPQRFPARQTREASEAIARLHALDPARCRFPQQDPVGIDAGAFHTDVLAVGNERFFMLHELAFVAKEAFLADLRATLGEELFVVEATTRDLPAASAIGAYPFNSQVVTRDDGSMCIVAPEDSREDVPAREFLEKVVAANGPVKEVFYRDVRQSMRNGGRPACLRLRVPLDDAEAAALGANVLLSDALHDALCTWVDRHYRETLAPADLADPMLARETMAGLDELTTILKLGSIYDFQR
jgi:succinylarginine dihydrolase